MTSDKPRDPRIDPKVGDRLRHPKFIGCDAVTVVQLLEGGLYFNNGGRMAFRVTLPTWRESVKDAEVLHVAE